MLDVKQEGIRMIIDVREMIKTGMHPKREILETIQNAAKGTVFEIHLPHAAQPLVAAIEQLGLDCVINELGPGHFRLLSLKMN
jgi:hypothetical protein